MVGRAVEFKTLFHLLRTYLPRWHKLIVNTVVVISLAVLQFALCAFGSHFKHYADKHT